MASLAQFDAFLKEYYTKDKIEALTYTDRPLYGNIKKEPDQSGDLYVHPVIVGNPQGHASTRAKAQAGASQAGTGANVVGKKWTVLYGDYADSVEINEKTIAASRNDVGSFLRHEKLEIDRLHEGFADIFGFYVYAHAGMALGSGTISTGVITLVNADDIVNYEVGQILVASANDGSDSSHTLLGTGSEGFVIAINKGAGTLTVSATSGGAAGTPTGWTGTMFFFRSGDFGGAGATRIMLGLQAWIPSSDPSATTFEGVNRTSHITALSGVRLPAADYANMGIEQRCKLLVTRMAGRAGSRTPKAIYMHPEKWQVLADSLESRGQREVGVKEGKFGYTKLVMATGGGFIDVFSDRFCPSSVIWALNTDYIKLGSYESIPKVVNGDGLMMLRKSTTDDYEYRLRSFPAFAVPCPGYQGRIPAP